MAPIRTLIINSLLLLLVGCSGVQDGPESQSQHSPADTTQVTMSGNADSFDREVTSVGQMVYVPVYSHIYQQDRKKTFNLTATLSIRNTDPYRSMGISEITYFDSNGNLVEQYLDSTLTLSPLSSTSFVVEESDLRGGVGANFIVNWQSDKSVTPPVIEAVMISTSQQQGISFLSEGRVLQEHQPRKSN